MCLWFLRLPHCTYQISWSPTETTSQQSGGLFGDVAEELCTVCEDFSFPLNIWACPSLSVPNSVGPHSFVLGLCHSRLVVEKSMTLKSGLKSSFVGFIYFLLWRLLHTRNISCHSKSHTFALTDKYVLMSLQGRKTFLH